MMAAALYPASGGEGEDPLFLFKVPRVPSSLLVNMSDPLFFYFARSSIFSFLFCPWIVRPDGSQSPPSKFFFRPRHSSPSELPFYFHAFSVSSEICAPSCRLLSSFFIWTKRPSPFFFLEEQSSSMRRDRPYGYSSTTLSNIAH